MKFWVFLLIVCCALAPAQGRDFLTADEIDQVRLAQDPNERLVLYVQFAKQRLELVRQLVAAQKPGSSVMVHDTLEQYNKIIDAIDTTADDGLARKLDISIGMKAVAEAEKDFVPVLKEIEESAPKDLARYQFVLQQAIETTEDSLELSKEDLSQRSTEIAERQQREKQEIEGMMQPKDREEKKAAEKKRAAQEKKSKPPTLLKKGETIKQR